MRNFISYTVIAFILCISFISCSNKDWEKLSADEMKSMLIDISIVEAYMQNTYTDDSIRVQVYNSIAKKHGFTKKDWDSSQVYYSKNRIADYEIIYKEALDSLTKMRDYLSERNKIVDSINNLQSLIELGNIDGYDLLKSENFKNYLSNSISYLEYKPKTLFDDNIELCLSAFTGLINNDNLDSLAYIKMTYFYADTTRKSDSIFISNIKDYELKISVDSAKTLDKLIAGIFVKNTSKDKVLLLGRPTLKRKSKKTNGNSSTEINGLSDESINFDENLDDIVFDDEF